MYRDEKKILWLSFLVSIVFHIFIFSIFYFIKLKPKEPEKEKIITVSLDTESLNQKPFINPQKVEKKEKQEEKPIIKEPEKPIPKPHPTPKAEPSPKPAPTPPTPEVTSSVKSEAGKSVESQPQTPSVPKSENITTPQPPQKVDLSAGRPDQFKTPPKKEEDINGYLKDLIRWLNQQARERDLYPPIAKRLKIEGEVIIRVTINEDGTIDENSITIVEGSGYNVLDRGAVDIIKKLQPLKKPPKRITVEIPIVFQIIYM